jgi:hypothetical protein
MTASLRHPAPPENLPRGRHRLAQAVVAEVSGAALNAFAASGLAAASAAG